MVGADPFNRLQSALLYPSEFTPSAHWDVPVCTLFCHNDATLVQRYNFYSIIDYV